jgi:2'-5' RNA ligase
VGKYLYFIAILPPVEIAKQVTSVKEEMFERFKSSHTLKSPPHITLQKPFSRTVEAEPSITEILTNFALSIMPFEIYLSGYGHFDKRVLFINVLPNEYLNQIHIELQQCVKTELNFSEKEIEIKFTPHMTLVHKDLSPAMFNLAWSSFQNWKIEFSFKAESISLLKYNDKNWEINKIFYFLQRVGNPLTH